MANKKITDLPANTGLALDTLFEDVKSPGGVPVSQKVALSELITFLSTNFTSLSINGGTVVINADGSANFAGGTFAVDGSGNITGGNLSLAGGNITTDGSGNFNATGNFTADGAISVGLGLYLMAFAVIDGSGNFNLPVGAQATMGSGNFSVSSSGDVAQAGGFSITTGGGIVFNGNGSVSNFFLTTNNTTNTATFNTNGQNETIYDDSATIIAALTINLPATTVAGQILRYVTKAVTTAVTVNGTVSIGAAITSFAANASVAWQAVDNAGTFIRIQ